MSKQKEINVLKQTAEATDPNSYLAGLYTESMVAWAAMMINQDFLPDIYGAYEREIGASSELRLELHEEKMRNQHIIAQRERDAVEAERKLEQVHDWLENQTRLANQALSRVGELEADLYLKQCENEELGEKLAERDDEILRLKAKMFDLMERLENK